MWVGSTALRCVVLRGAVPCCASSAAVQHLANAGRRAQLADGLGLNLADALASDLWAGRVGCSAGWRVSKAAGAGRVGWAVKQGSGRRKSAERSGQRGLEERGQSAGGERGQRAAEGGKDVGYLHIAPGWAARGARLKLSLGLLWAGSD